MTSSHRRGTRIGAGMLALSLLAGACAGDDDSSGVSGSTVSTTTDPLPKEEDVEEPTGPSATTEAPDCDKVDPVTFQVEWLPQAEYAGFYAAVERESYAKYCLDVTIARGGVGTIPQQKLAKGDVDFALAWTYKGLQSHEQGADIVHIAQLFQRSGTLQVSLEGADILSVADFEGKRIGRWGFGNEYELMAALNRAELDPTTDVELVQQDFNLNALLARDVDAAMAMTYDELAYVLEAVDPNTGDQYTLDDLNVISYEEEGVGLLQNAIWADASRLAEDQRYRDVAERFLAASFEGWAYCRDEPESCVDIVTDAGSQIGRSHQLWMMNETNKLIWPSEGGIGHLDPAALDRTVDIAVGTRNPEGASILSRPPADRAFDTRVLKQAWTLLGDDIDIRGTDFEPLDVALEPGGS